MLNIKIPNIGNLKTFSEFIIDMAMTVKIYAISLMLTLLVLNLRIANIANKPNAKVMSI